jgi:hypothetical protein
MAYDLSEVSPCPTKMLLHQAGSSCKPVDVTFKPVKADASDPRSPAETTLELN